MKNVRFFLDTFVVADGVTDHCHITGEKIMMCILLCKKVANWVLK